MRPDAVDDPQAGEIPRSQKFVPGDRIETLMLEVLEGLIEAAYPRSRAAPLMAANRGLENLRHLLRLAMDMKLINLKAYEIAARGIDGAGGVRGRVVGIQQSWRQATAAKKDENNLTAKRHLRRKLKSIIFMLSRDAGRKFSLA